MCNSLYKKNFVEIKIGFFVYDNIRWWNIKGEYIRYGLDIIGRVIKGSLVN